MRHTSLALAIALQLGSFTAFAETAAVPSLPATPATNSTATPASAAPATAVTPATSAATAATPAATPAAVKPAPEAKPAVKTEAAPVAVKEAAPAAKATEATSPGAARPCPSGGPLMTAEERDAHREKLRTLDPEARQAYMMEHRAMMQARMREAMGIAGEANPPPDFTRPNPLMTAEERTAHREKLRTLTGKDREAYLEEHYAKLRERAQKIAEADENLPPMPDFEAQRKRIMELRDNLRREMEEYRAKMQEFSGWQGAPGPEMGQPWGGPGPQQGWGVGPQQGWRHPGPGPWGGANPEEGMAYPPRY